MATVEGEEWRAPDEAPERADPDRLSDRSDEEVLAEAREGIERHRKTDVELALVGPDGSPAANRRVEVRQARQAFLFGSPIYEIARAARSGVLGRPELSRYTHFYTGLLNAATALCYWNERGDPWFEKFQGRTLFREFEAQADWARAHGLAAKGHPLVWTVPKAVPDWLRRYDTGTQMKFLEVRVRDLVGGLRGKVDTWDLVNEMLWEPSWRHLSERCWPHIEPIDEMLTYIVPAMHWARDEAPDATLLVNEYGLVYSVRRDPPEAGAASQRRRYLELAAALAREGASPDALGIQAHTGGRWYRLADLKAVLDELATSGLPLHITEFGASFKGMGPEAEALPPEEKLARQIEYVTNVYTVAFGHPAVEAVSSWGLPAWAFPDEAFRGAPVDALGGRRREREVDPAPLYEALRRLLREEWMTRLEATSDAAGRVRFRGSRGEYRLRYAADRASAAFTVAGPGPCVRTLRLAT